MKQPDQEETIISLKDITRLMKKSAFPIALGSFFFAALAGSYTLTRPIVYEAEATFRQKEKSASSLTDSSIASLFLNNIQSSGTKEAVSTIKSRSFLKKLIRQENLQGMLVKKGSERSFLGLMADNLLVQYAHLVKKTKPLLADPKYDLGIQDLRYEGETPLFYTIQFTSESRFQIPELDLETDLGDPIKTGAAAFTLVRKSGERLTGTQFTLSIAPLPKVAKELGTSIVVEPDKDDENLLVLKTTNADRFLAAHLMNRVTHLYQDNIKEDHKRVAQIQLSYLHDLQKEMSDKLQSMLADYAKNISKDFSTIGFANREKALEFFVHVQEKYKGKLLALDLNIKKNLNAQSLGSSFVPFDLDDPSNRGLAGVTAMLSDLKQQKDAIELALNHTSHPDPDFFQNQLKELEEVRRSSAETDELLSNLEQDLPLKDTSGHLFHSKYMAKIWADKLLETKKNKLESDLHKEGFIAYLKNLKHFFQVYEKTLKENVTHQQNTDSEFQGIDLKTANELYISYSRDRNEVESGIAQADYTLSQMQDPDFELSSLSTVLKDPISQNLIQSASNLLIQQKDDRNRSEKELERLQKQLNLHKSFLQTHLAQSRQLLELRKDLLQKKVLSLHRARLGLIQQQTSILDEQIADTLSNQLQNLYQERSLIAEYQKKLQDEMAKMPEELIAEKLIDQQINLNERMVEEITKLFESTNISHHLEVIQSAPVDLAIPEIHPKSPRLPLFIALGAILGAFLSSLILFGRSILQGIPASPENLLLKGAHVSGSFSGKKCENHTDEDLGTLRRLTTFLKNSKTKSLLMMQGNAPDLSILLAKLLNKEGKRVLILPLSFDSPAKDLPGLLQVLQGEAEIPAIHHTGEYHWISTGGISRYSNELLRNPRFEKLLEDLEKQYDLVLAVSHALPCSAEAEGQMVNFRTIAITITNEKLHELHPYTDELEDKQITYIFHE